MRNACTIRRAPARWRRIIRAEEIGEHSLEWFLARGGGEGTSVRPGLAQNPKGRCAALSGVPGRSAGLDNCDGSARIMFYLARNASDARCWPADPAAKGGAR